MGSLSELAVICTILSLAVACGTRTETPVLAKDVMDFNTLFSENCSGCHGVDGKQGAAPLLNSAVYLAIVPKDALRRTIERGVSGTPMPAFAQSEGGDLYPAQIDALLKGIEDRWARSAEPNAALPPYSVADIEPDVARGEQVFTIACAACHADKGKAGSITNGSFLSLVSDQGLRTSTIVSRPDLGAPDWRGYVPNHVLTNQEITDVVAYLVSLRPRRPEIGQTHAPEMAAALSAGKRR